MEIGKEVLYISIGHSFTGLSKIHLQVSFKNGYISKVADILLKSNMVFIILITINDIALYIIRYISYPLHSLKKLF